MPHPSKKRTKADRKSRRTEKHSDAFFDTPSTFVPNPPRKQLPPLSAKNEAQGQMISQIMNHDITFVIGPAGTGKTYVAASLAAEAFESGEIEKIVITRPMQGCDEEIGFLPGELDEKYAPWIAPVIDVLNERLGKGRVGYMMKSGQLEAKPLQFMRGSSFKNCWIILDEAQNVTPKQMKMFLTRIGEGSKMIIDGDPNQSDLVDNRGISQVSGLQDARSLRRLPEIGYVEFSRDDIVRHGLVRKLLDFYEG